MPDVDQAPPEVHEAECHCDSFSDCYKDVTGRRPRDEIARWTCARVTQWFHENYIETSPRHFGPRVPFEGEPAPRTLPVTPAERTCAAVLRAWLEWPGTEMPIGEYTPYELFLLDVGDWLQELGLAEVETSEPTPAGAALLARVEAAPVLTAEQVETLTDMIESIESPASEGWTLPNGQNVIIKAPGGHLSIVHTSSLQRWAGKLREILRAGTTPIDAPPAKEPR